MRQFACLSLIIVIGAMLLSPGIAQASMYTFATTELKGLSHWSYYTWGIDWTVPEGEQISSATLSIDHINTCWATRNILSVHLLDGPAVGAIQAGWDMNNRGDAFENVGLPLTSYTDDDHWPNPSEDFSYEFDLGEIDTLGADVADGIFGLGFDPQGHYLNDGMRLTITTETERNGTGQTPGGGGGPAITPIPEPSTMVFTLIGLGFAARKRLRRRLGQ